MTSFILWSLLVIYLLLYVGLCATLVQDNIGAGQHKWQLLIQCSRKNIRLVLAKFLLHGW